MFVATQATVPGLVVPALVPATLFFGAAAAPAAAAAIPVFAPVFALAFVLALVFIFVLLCDSDRGQHPRISGGKHTNDRVRLA